jgi:cyclophilin family peptidyl-prolyl cis-trans isomerase
MLSMRLFRLYVLAAFFGIAALFCPSGSYAQTSATDVKAVEAVVTTELGTFRFEFAPEKAPHHVEQFLERARQGYYDGSAFHRVVANGMIQGGDPLLKNPKTTKNLWGSGGLNLMPAEFSDMKHDRGVVSTVSIPGKADSDGAQFFVCVVPQPSLDGKYSTFGRVTEGMSVVEKISQQSPVGSDGVLDKPVRILSIAIEKKKEEPFATTSVSQLKRIVTLKTTLGTLKIQTEPDWAPENARNFLKLSAMGWYNGTEFHRIVKGFVAQGGMGGPPDARWVRTVKGEFRPDVKHVRGIVSMARGDDPDSASTSFFLVLGDSPHLDGQYSAFGRVVEGLEVLDAFEKEDLDGEKPKRKIEIIEASVE